MGEEAQGVQPMVERDDDDSTRRETRAVVARLGARASDKAAAVDPDHHGQARAIARRGRGPDVEIEAILGDRGLAEVDVVPYDALDGMGPEGAGRAHPGPGRDRLGRAPTQAPERRRGVGNAFIDTNAARIRLGDGQRAAFDGQGIRHQAGSPAANAAGFAARRHMGVSSRPAKRAFGPSASSMRKAAFHFAIRSERANEPTLSWPAPQPIAR